MCTWCSSRLLRDFYCLRIVHHFFLPFFVLRSRIRRRIFRSHLRQRMLLLYAGIEMKAFALWSVFRRRNRRTWSLLVVRASTVRIRSFVHSPSLRSTDVWQHDFSFLPTLILDTNCYFSFRLFSEIDVSTCLTTIYIFCFLKDLILWIIMRWPKIQTHLWSFMNILSHNFLRPNNIIVSPSDKENKLPFSLKRIKLKNIQVQKDGKFSWKRHNFNNSNCLKLRPHLNCI